MDTQTDDRQESPGAGVNPTTESRAKFAGDATGAVGGGAAPSVTPDTLQHEPQSPDAHTHDPGTPAHQVEDDGWVKEEQGSLLAHEREGVPEDEMPQHMPESAAQPRPKA